MLSAKDQHETEMLDAPRTFANCSVTSFMTSAAVVTELIRSRTDVPFAIPHS